MKTIFTIWLLSFPLIVFSETDVRFFNLIIENDFFYQEDGGYTNGFALNYAHGFKSLFSSENTPSIFLPVVNWTGFNNDLYYARGFGIQIGQIMNTPENIHSRNVLEDEQPYVGLLVGRLNLYGIQHNSSRRMGLILGVVGPSSGAEQSQKFIHTVTGSDEPQGWEHQINNEPVFRVEVAHINQFWKSSIVGDLESDISFFNEGGIGNLLSNISTGLRWRFGSRLSDSLPIAMDLPGREINPTAGMPGTHWKIFIS